MSSTIKMRLSSNGNIIDYDENKVYVCGDCAKSDPNYDTSRSGEKKYFPQYQLAFDGAKLVCPTCNDVKAVTVESFNEFVDVVLPKLYISANGVLSGRIPREMWAKIASYFEYEDFAKLAEYYDDIDEFDKSACYEEMLKYSKGQWKLKDVSDAEVVENILGVLPENSRTVLQLKEAMEREAEHQKALEELSSQRQMDAGMQLFQVQKGEYITDNADELLKDSLHVKIGDGFNIYGGGREFRIEKGGQHIWLLNNNGADGDDWIRNNVGTGGAGAIGYRFDATPERLAFVKSLIPVSKQRTSLEVLFRESTGIEFEGESSIPKDIGRIAWIKVNSKFYMGIDQDGCVAIGHQHRNDKQFTYLQGNYAEVAKYEYSKANYEKVISNMPEWARRAFSGKDVTGRFRLPRRGGNAATAADAIRDCICSNEPLNQVEFTPDVYPVFITKVDGVYSALIKWSDGKVIKGQFASVSLWPYKNRQGFPVSNQQLSFSDLSKDAARLLEEVDKKWLDRINELIAIKSITKREVLQESKDRWTDCKLEKLTCETGDDTKILYLYRVEWNWACMGEDGDAGCEIELFDNESDATEQYKKFKELN